MILGSLSSLGIGASIITQPSSRGAFYMGSEVFYSQQTLPEDPVGTHSLTLTNIVVGSRIHIQSGTTTLHDAVAASSSVVIPMQVYAGGSPLNNWTIKIRKGSSSPTYRPYETQMTATVGASSIYVSQIPDE
jgi:hypothetical protein